MRAIQIFLGIALVVGIIGTAFMLSKPMPIRLCTYNVRYNNPGDGINAWPLRKERVVGALKNSKADFLCLQEVLHSQKTYLDSALSQYQSVGVGRDDGKEKGEYSPVYFLQSKYQLLKYRTVWLSPHPDDTGSKGWDAALPRIATLVYLKAKANNKELLVISTHFDHIGVQARLESAKLLIKTIKESKMPYVLLGGDLNTEPKDGPLNVFINKDEGAPLLTNFQGKEIPTFRNFKQSSTGKVIDYILASPSFRWQKQTVDTTAHNGYYPSDHCSVVGEFVW